MRQLRLQLPYLVYADISLAERRAYFQRELIATSSILGLLMILGDGDRCLNLLHVLRNALLLGYFMSMYKF